MRDLPADTPSCMQDTASVVPQVRLSLLSVYPAPTWNPMSTTVEVVEKAPVVKTELDVSALDPDADGDGKVSPLEKEIFHALKAADLDGSGTIGVGELYAVIGNLVGEKRKVKNLGRMVVALLLALMLALTSIFVVSMLAGEAIKESKVKGGAMTTPDGTSAVAVDMVESTTTLWDLPSVNTATLAKMKVIPL